MTTPAATTGRKPLARMEETAPGPGRVWAIVLAGGEGVRLRPLTRRLCGDERPKQYAALFGSRSLLRQTLDRVARLVPRERTVVVGQRRHARYLAAEFSGAPAPHILLQPEDRGTAAGVLFPAHWIARRDPEATVAVFPSDHFVLEEETFMGCVGEAATSASRDPHWIVLLGAIPTEAEPDYGWIEPGEPLGHPDGGALCRVRAFWEKPSVEEADRCLKTGCLWNTFVFTARAAALLAAGRRLLPALDERLARIGAFADTEHEAWAIQQAYALAPGANLSRSVFAVCPSILAVRRLPALAWCDLGTPDRVLRTLGVMGARLAAPGELA